MLDDLKSKLIEYGKLAGVKGFTPGFSGNLSARCGDKIIITATGTANGYLKEDDFAVIDFAGNVVEGSRRPSSEKMLHVKFYELRPEINYIFHVHSPYLTSFAASGMEMNENVLAEIVYCFGKIPLAKYALPGSVDLVENTSLYFKDYDVVLMENHGVIVGDRDVEQAYLKLELCEAYAKTLICSKILGGAKILPEIEVEKIYSLRNK
jgi:class II aldolase/adducin-like protein